VSGGRESRRAHLDTVAVSLLVVCCAVWGLSQVATKVTLPDVPPLLQAGLRSLGAALLLLAWSRRRGLAVLTADGSGRAGLLAGVLFAAEFGCLFVGLQFTPASRMVVFLYLAPFVVALGMPLIAPQERLRGLQTAGLVLAFAGVVWAFSEGFTQAAAGPRQWLGDLLGIVAATLWGLTTLALRGTRLAAVAPEKALLYQLAVSAVALLLASALAGEPWPRAPGAVSALAWAALAYQIVVVTFASYLAWFWLIRHYPATHVSAFTLLTPVFGLLAGVLLLGEPLTARLLTALAAVCAGIALVNRAPPKARG
jgi:drug/metabolite transporter (DMT)-like permease